MEATAIEPVSPSRHEHEIAALHVGSWKELVGARLLIGGLVAGTVANVANT